MTSLLNSRLIATSKDQAKRGSRKMYTLSFWLLIFISFTTDLLFAYPLRGGGIGSSTTVGETQGPTTDQGGKEKAPSWHVWTTAEIYGVTLGLVPGLWLVISLGAFCYYWYQTSYRRVLIDWKKRNIAGHPRTDCRVVFGRDGRASWTDCYGPYDAQTAVDMMNTLMLCQDRNPDPLLGQLPIFAIRGKELKSVENAFTDLHIGDRPSFRYQRHHTPKTDHRQAAFDKRKKRLQDKKDRRNAKKAKQRAQLLEANRAKLEVAKIKTAKLIAAQKEKAEKKQEDIPVCTVDGKVTATSTTQVEVITAPELPKPGQTEAPSTPPASSSQNDVVIDIEPLQKSAEQAESSAPDYTPPVGESIPTRVESELRYY